MQEKETTKRPVIAEARNAPRQGRLVAIDPGTKRVGVAVCDDFRITIRRLPIIQRSSWKKLLAKIKDILDEYDAAALIVGLPYNSDGSESEMSAEARRMAGNFAASLNIPVFLQDERVTTYEARGRLWAEGVKAAEMAKRLDSEAAAIILEDFLDRIKT